MASGEADSEIYVQPSPNGSLYSVQGENVRINFTGSPLQVFRDSSKVRTSSLSNYAWEAKRYLGRQVAVHKNADFMAYVIYAGGGSTVRVLKRSTKFHCKVRFNEIIVEISWSFSADPHYLACVAQSGDLHVYEICSVGESQPMPVLHLKPWIVEKLPTDVHHVAWCPFIPDDASEPDALDDLSKMLVVTHGNRVEIMNFDAIRQQYGVVCNAGDLNFGYLAVDESSDISVVTVSPDATAFALGTVEGFVKFYIVDNFDDARCAHKWRPHDGLQVTALVFLDNVKASASSEAQFWKFALTGAKDNHEIKLWSCESWNCLQTIRINTQCDESNPALSHFQLDVDWTASFIFLSDLHRKALYVMQLMQLDDTMQVVDFSDFPLVQPYLSIAVLSASRKAFRPFTPPGHSAYEDIDDDDDGDSGSDEQSKVRGVQAVLFAVTPKSLLQVDVRFRPVDILGSLNGSFASSAMTTNCSFQDDLSFSESIEPTVDVPTSSKPPPLALPNGFLPVADGQQLHGSAGHTNGHSPTGSVTPHMSPPGNHKRQSYAMLDSDRQQASPSSQEVSSIFRHTDAYEKNEAYEQHGDLYERPQTPVVHALQDEPDDNELSASGVHTYAQRGGEAQDVDLNDVLGELRKAAYAIQIPRISGDVDQHLQEVITAMHEQRRLLEDVLKRMAFVTDAAAHSKVEAHSDTQLAHGSLQRVVNDILGSNFRDFVANSLQEGLDGIQHQIQATVTSKLSATDSMLKDHVARLIKSKAVVDSLSQAIWSTMSVEFQTKYRDAFQKHVVPSFDSATKQLFTQLNDSFVRGTRDYVHELKLHADAVRQGDDAFRTGLVNNVTELMQQNIDQMRGRLERHLSSATTSLQSQLEKHVQQQTEQMRDAMVAQMRAVVRDEVQIAMREHQQQVLRSTAATPVLPMEDRQQRLFGMLQQRRYAAAFQEALSASDLSVLMYVCTKVNPAQLFSAQPPLLQQPSILALLQQLSADLSSQTDVKIRYLEEAMLALDRHHPTIKEHIPVIVSSLQNKVNAYLQANPMSPHARSMKMLLLSSQGIVASQ